MKSLRLGNFRSILEMLGPDGHAGDDAAGPRPSRARPHADPIRAFGNAFDQFKDDHGERNYVPLDRLARLYDEDRPDGKQPKICPADDDAIAAELCLGSARTGEDLQRIRRSFAMRNHPDRVPDWLRDEATRRMTIANALIDRAMRERRKKTSIR
jgi:hypothetical protein